MSADERHPLACVEVGGTGTQTVLFAATPRIVDGAVRPDGADLAIAVPGIVDGGRVVAASNLGWFDVDPVVQLGLQPPAVVVCNDAEAAALGEAALRDEDRPPDLVFVGLGTGVGGAVVRDGQVVETNLLGHGGGFGDAPCRCGGRGCLETVAAGWALPQTLAKDDVASLAGALARAIATEALTAGIDLVVVGGGVADRYPAVIEALDACLTATSVEGSQAPDGAKSAAAWGLRQLVTRTTHA